MTGAAPVPVPPPMPVLCLVHGICDQWRSFLPAVMNTMWLSPTAFITSSSDSSAACRPNSERVSYEYSHKRSEGIGRVPISGLAPAPSPLLIDRPSWMLTPASLADKLCVSVLHEMNSTPVKLFFAMLLIELPPHPATNVSDCKCPVRYLPPIPTTLIFGVSTCRPFLACLCSAWCLLSEKYIHELISIISLCSNKYLKVHCRKKCKKKQACFSVDNYSNFNELFIQICQIN